MEIRKTYSSEYLTNPEELYARETFIWKRVLESDSFIIPPFPKTHNAQDIKTFYSQGLTIRAIPNFSLSSEQLHQHQLVERFANRHTFLPEEFQIQLTDIFSTIHHTSFINYQHLYKGGWLAIETIAQPRIPSEIIKKSPLHPEAYQVTPLQQLLHLPDDRRGLSHDYIHRHIREYARYIPYTIRLPYIDEWNVLSMREGWGYTGVLEHTDSVALRLNKSGNLEQTDIELVIGNSSAETHPSFGSSDIFGLYTWKKVKEIGYRLAIDLQQPKIINKIKGKRAKVQHPLPLKRTTPATAS
jgi:hypothetical protein